MSNTNTTNPEDNLAQVESALTKTEHFIENNQKIIVGVIFGLIVLVAGYWGVKKFVIQPRNVEAQTRMFSAQHYFEIDSFRYALNGDGTTSGFLKIIDNYGSTKAGNLAYCYAGLSYLKLGDYSNAIKFLKDFSAEDDLLKYVATGAIGDAYYELGQKDKALSYYKDAAEGDNELTAPAYLMKLGYLYEENGNFDKALASYKTIKEDYKKSNEARSIDKYITRAELKLKK